MRSAFHVMVFVAAVLSSFGCKKDETITQPPPGTRTRTLAISTVPRLDPPPTVQDYINAIDLAYNAGARGMFQSWRWSDIEPTSGMYKFADITNNLTYMGNVRGFDLLVGIQVLNTNVKETPHDLLTVQFDSSLMVQRFHTLVDSLQSTLNSHVKYLSIGNEVDAYLSMHPSEWQTYKLFYDDAVAYVHSVLPSIKVGVTVMFDGARGSNAANVSSLISSSDVYILTYYPLGQNFVVRADTSPSIDFPQMLTLANGKPLILQEVGYPSSTTLTSSEQKQSNFVARVFAAWSSAGDRIPFLNFFALHDFSSALVDTMVSYYNFPGDATNFRAYLGTLGLRNVDGTPKLGWQAFVDGAASLNR